MYWIDSISPINPSVFYNNQLTPDFSLKEILIH